MQTVLNVTRLLWHRPDESAPTRCVVQDVRLLTRAVALTPQIQSAMPLLTSNSQTESFMAMKTDMTVARFVRRLSPLGRDRWLKPYVMELLSGGSPDPERVVDLLDLVRSGSNIHTRALACWSLGKIPMSEGMRERSREALHQVLAMETGSKPGCVIASLMVFHILAGIVIAITSISAGKANTLREIAAASLAKVGDASSIPVLESAVQSSKRVSNGELRVRLAALRALHSILLNSPVRPITNLTDDATAGISRMIVAMDIGCQMMALDVLREYGTSRALSGLKRLLRRQMFSPMQPHVEEAIAAIKSRHDRLVRESQLLRPSFDHQDHGLLLRPSSYSTEEHMLLRPQSGDD